MAVRQLLEALQDDFRDEDWRSFYARLSENAKAACAYDEFLEGVVGLDRIPDLDLDKLGIDEIDVRVEGDTAYAAYITTYDGEDIDAVTADAPDVFTKVDGKWYLDSTADPEGICT
jgi:hypothetical protein